MHCLRSVRAVIGRLSAVLLLVWASFAVQAQSSPAQSENMSIEYAQVLRVQPVYETLRVTRMQERCTDVPVDEPEEGDGKSTVSRLVGSVRRVFGKDETAPDTVKQCRSVPVRQELRRPVAYDVDYVYKGTKYRSRLLQDPGNRLRIKVSVTPVPADQHR